MSLLQSILQEATQWRHSFHQCPELGYEEVNTSRQVATLLESFGLEVHVGLAGTGVIGTLSTIDPAQRAQGPTIGLRADMDALPFTELGDVPYRSCHSGVMHACGHDGHTAMLLGAAKYLSQTKSFHGTVHFIFQPAEEMLGGARRMVDEGLFEQFPMESVFGLHNWPGLPQGHIAVNPGAIMASLDTFKVTLTGQSCHAAMPHQGVDPIIASAALITTLQTITSRQLSPLDSAVVSVTQVHGGEATNIIPETVVLNGTFRCLSPSVQAQVRASIESMSHAVAATHGVRAEVSFSEGYHATVNHPEQAQAVYDVACATLGEERTHWNIAPSMASEDFSCMLDACPGAYFWLGADGATPSKPLHNAYYDFNDAIIETGIVFWRDLVEARLKPAT